MSNSGLTGFSYPELLEELRKRVGIGVENFEWAYEVVEASQYQIIEDAVSADHMQACPPGTDPRLWHAAVFAWVFWLEDKLPQSHKARVDTQARHWVLGLPTSLRLGPPLG